MRRYMRGMSCGGYASGEALTNDQLRAAVPSIFATTAHESRSDRFAVVPTINVVEGLRNEGFQPFMAQQANTRIPGKADFTKHLIRFRHQSIARADGQAFEVIVVNANDGTSAYQMLPGFFRFVCANGLMVGDTFEEIKVRHTGDAVGEVIEGAYRVLEEAPRVCDQVQRFQGLPLREEEQQAFAEAAHVLRFPDHHRAPDDPKRRETAITADMLLRAVRREDASGDLWSTFNRVQEHTMGRTHISARGRTANGQRRRQSIRRVEGIDQNKTLNRALWTLAERMAELKA